jgi:hypothetical protein
MDVTLVTEPGFGMPSVLPAVNFTRPNVPLSTSRVIVPSTGLTTRVTGLWPTRDGYSSWAGACNDSDPATSPTNGSRGAPVVIDPGAVGAVTARLAPLDVTVTLSTSGAPAAGARVTAVSQNCPSSTAERSLYLGQTDATGLLKSSLPHGSWRLSVVYGTTTTTSTTFVPAATGVSDIDTTVTG